MNLEIKTIDQALNKAYLAQNPYKDEINLFKENYTTLLNTIQTTDNEETLKDYINDFLKNTYYKGKFLSKENVNNIDLIILNGNHIEDKIGVLIETKAIKNSSEMITKTDLNKKAFQELILYYLEERISNANIEIKHLIITNSIEWFIFNATEFERIFYQNKPFQKTFIDWNSGKLVSKNKDWFYKEIAKPFIEDSEETITCTNFTLPNLSDFQNLSDTKLIELYKIFSPEHLLKLPFANDSNTLNQDFYHELLHIIGLYETKDNARTIERLKEKDRHEGSFLENVISIIDNDDILQNIENPEEFGETKEEQIFSIALELCITWVNRVLFLKLLESQLLRYNANNPAYKFLNSEKITDFERLKELFFEVLAVNTSERKPTIQEKYKYIPYLNSSLFEQTQLEKSAVKINHLKQHAQLPISGQTVLKDENEKTKTGSLPVLKYFLDFLDSYNFASDKTVEIQEKNKTLINSSVLGLIFEKLNGYKEGSFYTPGYVTMYICRETIRNTVIQKFNSTYRWNCTNLKQVYNQINSIDIQQANQTFNSIRICDPAVGSGHFLVSALNELIAIKSELGILMDTNGQTLRNTYCEVENDELYTSHFDDLFVYNFKDREAQRIQEVLFHEKRILIENCLFGVDINPKSVQICRLRLWIELLKNAYYTKESQFTDLETLPNIDINIKCGNSLVSHFAIAGNGVSNTQSLKLFTEKYKQVVVEYKNTSNKNVKQTLERFIREQKENFARTVNPNDEDVKLIRKIESEIGVMPIFFSETEHIQWQMKIKRLTKELEQVRERYQIKLKTIYKEAFEWRFEFPEILDDNGYFVGFDAIIGNPPYISIEGLNPKQKVFYKEFYDFFFLRYDMFACFIERALQLLKPNSYLSFIVPSVLLNSKSFCKLRQYLVQNTSLYMLDSLKDGVFDKAVVPTMIFCVKNVYTENNSIKISKNKLQDFYYINQDNFKNTEMNVFNLELTDANFDFIQKLEKDTIPLGKIAVIANAINTGELTKYLVQGDYEKDKKYIKVLKGGSIKKWNFTFEKYFLLKKFEDFVSLGDIKVLEQSKLMMKRIGKKFEVCIDNTGIAALHTVHTIRITDKNFDEKFILGLLNSKLISYMFRLKVPLKGDVFPEFRVFDLNNQVAIKKVSPKEQKPLIQLVDKLLDLKKQNKSYQDIENQIDTLVYQLYNLTEKEINRLENEIS